MERALERVAAIMTGDPLDTDTMIGAQASNDQFEKILSYLAIGKEEGAEVLIGGHPREVAGHEGGYYIEPTVFKGHNKMRVFQEEIFGPVVSVTTFEDEAEAFEHRQRHAVRARRRSLDPGCLDRLPDGSRHPGRSGVDELLPPVPRGCRVRRVQGVGHRTREPQDDARPLPADQEPARQLQPRQARASSDR